MAFQNVSRQQLEALHRLTSAEFDPFRELLQTTRADTLARLVKADEVHAIHRLQGMATLCDSLLTAIEEARTRLSR